MECPLVKNKEVKDKCSINHCWYNFKTAKHNCAIKDTNNDHIFIYDVARIFNETELEAQKRIEKGKAKIKHWLKLIDLLEIVEKKGCQKCGHPSCKKTANCEKRYREEIRLKSKLPLEKVLEMYPSRWYAAVNLVEDNPILNKLII